MFAKLIAQNKDRIVMGHLRLPPDTEWLAELERRARRALADPNGGEAWAVVERRLAAPVANR